MVEKKWNFLWVSFEDCSPIHGCFGHNVAKTPNVDSFAEEACIYPNAFACTGVCAPSRAAIITGMYPTSIGAQHMRTTHTDPHLPELPTPYNALPPAQVKCFTEYLRASGYYCSNNSKTDYQFEVPITAWDDCSNTGHWRNRYSKDQPFFAVFNPTNTHESGSWESVDIELRVDPLEVPVPPLFPDTPRVRESIAKTYTQMSIADDRFGELVDQLKEDGLYESTIIIHWSDHGPWPRGKRWVYDTGIKVPFIVRIPGELDAGTQDHRLISTVDLGPTLLSLAGLPVPIHMEGKAFLGKYQTPEREFTYHSRDRYDTCYDQVRAVRSKRYKFITNSFPDLPRAVWLPFRNKHPIMRELLDLEAKGDLPENQRSLFETPRPVAEFYDLEQDPWEMNNIIDQPDHQSLIEEHKEALKGWQKVSDPYRDIDESTMVNNWYPEGKVAKTANPLFFVFGNGNYCEKPLTGIQRIEGPLMGQIVCSTEGASLQFRLSDLKNKSNSHWSIYKGFIPLERGIYKIEIQAQRIGFEASEYVELNLEIY